VTGAPASYIQVVFAQGIPLPKKTAFHVLGSILSGRSDAITTEMSDQIIAALSSLDSAKRLTEIVFVDLPANWIMEGCEIRPEPSVDKSHYPPSICLKNLPLCFLNDSPFFHTKPASHP